jgi:diguanylate cyclase (GGDEF)-like protein
MGRGTRVCRDVTEAWHRDRALNQAHHRERLVAGVVNSIRDEADPEKLLALTAAATREALDASFCAIYRMGDNRKLLRGVAYGENIGHTLVEQLDERINWLDSESRVVELPLDNYRVLAAAARHRQDINGAICVARTATDEPWSDDDRALVDGVVGQLGIAIEQIATHDALKELSRTDDLTGLKNRRAFMECLTRRHKHAMRTGRTSALLFTDLDNFKMVNDVHGHQRGDEVLIMLAELLERSVRETDVTARFGGDEFAIWLDEINVADAITKTSLMIKASQSLEAHSGGPDYPVRLSIGVAAFDPASGETLEALFARADAAMYQAKHDGKGTYALAPPVDTTEQQEAKS